MYGASLGLALGLNVNIGAYLTLFVETGARYVFNYSTTSTGGFSLSSGYILPAESIGDVFVRGYEGYASAGIMFRINDTYGGSN